MRAFFRAVSESEWNVEYAAARLRVSRRRAAVVINELLELGYVEALTTEGDLWYKHHWEGNRILDAFLGGRRSLG